MLRKIQSKKFLELNRNIFRKVLIIIFIYIPKCLYKCELFYFVRNEEANY